jgi:hypothetical protein
VVFEAIGFDPAPGNPDDGASMVATLRRATDALGEIDGLLAGDGDQRWLGQTGGICYTS